MKNEKEKKNEFTPVDGTSSSLSGFKVTSASGGIIKTSLDPNFKVSADHSSVLDVIEELAHESPQNVMLTGPQGCGKTELCIWFSARYNRPCIVMNCATVRETKDWFGYRDATDGTTFWHRSDFVRAVEMGGCVVVLDEFNRLHTTLHNTLYPLLDARRSSFVEELDGIVKVGPNTVFLATANVGFQHGGTHAMDSAIEDRFGCIVRVGFPEAAQEISILKERTGISTKRATQLSKIAVAVRKKSVGMGATLSKAVSTRQLLQTAIMMQRFEKKGIDPIRAFDYTIIPHFPSDGGTESEQSQVLQIVQGFFA